MAKVRLDSRVLSSLVFYSHDKQETDEVVQLQDGETRLSFQKWKEKSDLLFHRDFI